MTGRSRARSLNTLFVMAMIVLATTAGAATLRVEKDGSGDYTTIQAAVDAAADGDVIAIGPGHFGDWFMYQGWKFCVLLDGTKSLSFVGTSPEATLIGSEIAQVETGTYAFGLIMTSEIYSVSLDNLGIVNSFYGLNARGSHVHVSNCHFERCYYGLYIGTHANGVLTVTDCTFQGVSLTGVPTAIRSGAQWTAIERVEIGDWGTGVHLLNNGGADALIADCLIDGADLGRLGIYITDGPNATVRNSIIRNQQNTGLGLGGAGTVSILNNVIEQCGIAGVHLGGCTSLTMVDNIIQSSAKCFYLPVPNDTQHIRGNYFLRDVANNGYYITIPQHFPWGPYYEDFTLNYWGTTDVDEISLWILDGHDNPNARLYVVFEPMADSPVATEARSWSTVKDLFREE